MNTTIGQYDGFWMSHDAHEALLSACKSVILASEVGHAPMCREALVYLAVTVFENCEYAGISVNAWSNGRFEERQLDLEFENDNFLSSQAVA